MGNIERNLTDDRILALAGRQHGGVARWQLRQAGIPVHRIDYRLKRGWLETVHPAIYRVRSLTGPRQLEMTAVLACGPNAALSHQTAGTLLDIITPPAGSPPIHLSTTCDVRPRRIQGTAIHIYRVTQLDSDELTVVDGLPLTTPARTLLDLARYLSARALERVQARSERQGLLKREEITRLLARFPRRRGITQLRALIDSPAAPAYTRSEAEEHFLTLVRKGALPLPEVNALGCDAAVSLDGGISAQLAIRGTTGSQEWKGLRRVPLGIIASPRPS